MIKTRWIVFAALALPRAATAQWTYATSGIGELRGMSAVSSKVVWASGAFGTVVRSTDGGVTWTADSVAGSTRLDFRAIHAFNDVAAIIASAGEAEKGLAKVFATGDAGTTWNLSWSSDQPGVFLDAVAFWDSKNGIALSDPVDSAFFLIVTNDAGRTWTRIPPDRLPRVLPGEAAFAASGSSLVVHGDASVWIGTGGGGRGRVMHSPDRGKTWTVSETPIHSTGPAAGIFGLAFFDANRGVAVGGDYTKRRLDAQSVAMTTDAGRTWRASPLPPAAFLSGVAYAGAPDKLVAVGLAGTFVSRDSGYSWSQVDSIALNSVRFSGSSGWAVGPRGRVARWTP